MVARGDHGARTEHLGRAQDGAGVVRVGHAVKADDQRVALARDADILQLAPVQGLDLHRGPLMHRILGNRHLEVARVKDLGLDPGTRQHIGQPVGGVLGQDQSQFLTLRVQQSIPHRVDAEQPQRLFRLGPLGPFLVNHPGGFGVTAVAAHGPSHFPSIWPRNGFHAS
jgi:hypothetical protein